MRIYLVDDDRDDLENICDAISMLGCASEVKTFSEPERLLNVLKREGADIPNLVVLDHQTPGMKSVEAIKVLRKDKRFDNTAIAVYSSHLTPEKMDALALKGVDVAITKGLTIGEISGHVSKFCQVAAQKQKH